MSYQSLNSIGGRGRGYIIVAQETGVCGVYPCLIVPPSSADPHSVVDPPQLCQSPRVCQSQEDITRHSPRTGRPRCSRHAAIIRLASGSQSSNSLYLSGDFFILFSKKKLHFAQISCDIKKSQQPRFILGGLCSQEMYHVWGVLSNSPAMQIQV